eukprot:2987496-Pyramimonas_sp.AAC.1
MASDAASNSTSAPSPSSLSRSMRRGWKLSQLVAAPAGQERAARRGSTGSKLAAPRQMLAVAVGASQTLEPR